VLIKKVVIPAAGLGTRLLFATKEQPKEMLPIFIRGANKQLRLIPVLQFVFEKIYDAGFREFCFIVGRGKRAVEDHFTPDDSFVEYLKSKNKLELAYELELFYRKLRDQAIVFINQPKPRGFGDAVYKAKQFTDRDAFLVHAGDDLVISESNDHLERLVDTFKKYNADAALYVEKVKNPSKYGVIVGKEIEHGVYKVEKAIEKPSFPPSNIAIIAIYIFSPTIYQAIEKTRPNTNNEIQLTDAIQWLIDQKRHVYALELNQNEKRIDIGTPESYWKALSSTYEYTQL